MSESRSHMDLVVVIKSFIESQYTFNTTKLQIDSPDTKRPEMINGFIPDLLLLDDNLTIIGEAKTLDDFDRNHSKNQYEAYMRYCVNNCTESILIIGVPWSLINSAKNHFRLLKRKLNTNIKVIVINEMGRWWIV